MMEFLTGPQVCERYQVCSMTLYRWQRDEKVGFPKPLIIAGRRKLFKASDLLAWEQRRNPDFETEAA